jgi:2-aminoethylphosphonate dioxygenase
VTLRGLFSADEVAQWQAECDRLLAQEWVSPQNIRTPFRMGSTQTPERIDPVVDVSPLFSSVARDERLLAPLRAIWNDEARLFKDKLIFKMPGVDGYTMHQDWAWGWQNLCAADEILSVSVQIDGADAANGCIELFPGYHHKLLTPPGLQTNFRAEEVAQIDAARGIKMETQPGDVLIFHALTPHQSGKNTANYSRRSLYLTYNAARAGDLAGAYYAAYKERLGKEGSDRFFR